MKKIWIILILCTMSFELYAQYNLIINGSFEDTVGGAACYGPIENAKFWFNPHGSTPDLYTYFPGYCTGVSSLSNPSGYQLARTGNAYAGIYTYITQSITRDYIAHQLVDTLVAGECYYAEIFVSLANKSQYATNRFGFYFTNDTSGYKTLTGHISVVPQINTSGSVYADTSNWVKISGTFTASGGESFLIFGNFNDNNTTTKQLVNPNSGMNHAYYYLDDVFLIACDSLTAIESMFVLAVNIYPNPFSNELIFETNRFFKEKTHIIISIYDLNGIEVFQQTLDLKSKSRYRLQLSFLKKGLYVIRISSGNESYTKIFIKH